MNFFLENMPFVLVIFVVIILLFIVVKIKFKEHKNQFYSPKELELKLRAYERIMLFVERIEPLGMINRLNVHEYSIDMIKSYLIKNIILEYEYNLSQQIYFSNDLWDVIVEVKDQTINNISLICDGLNTDSTSQDFLDVLWKQTNIQKMHTLVKKKIKLEVSLINS